MPELPEVETLKRELSKKVSGKIFTDVWCNWPREISPQLPRFKKIIKGKRVLAVLRRAKMLVLELTGNYFLVIHLKMSGQLIYKLKTKNKKIKIIAGGHPQQGGLQNLPNKFTHVIFTFKDGSKLFFNDLRKFGWARLGKQDLLNNLHGGIGIEALSKKFSLEYFLEILKKYLGRKIKQILLDQALIAGIGNIYADEILFCAKVKPARKVKSIRVKEAKQLWRCIPKILKLAISKKGTSADLYVQLDGKPGGMVPYLKVYGREKQKCKRCSGSISKIKMNGRGTHFCLNCQK